jgi:hypothetical protein
MYRAKGDIVIGPMISEDLILFVTIIMLISAHFLEFLIADDGGIFEEVSAAIGDRFYSQIETNCLQQPLPRDLIKPVEFQSKRQQINIGETVFNFPVLPGQPENIELKRQHFGAARILVYPVHELLQVLSSCRVGVQDIHLPHLHEADVPHLQVRADCAGAEQFG